ncbi:hypothetical protein Tco_1014452, partial [Tanacetum coccineum]
VFESITVAPKGLWRLTAMASEHDCLEPDLQRFNNQNSSDDLTNTPSKEDLDNLFGPMFEDYFEHKSSDTTINSAAQPTHDQEDSPSKSSIIVHTHEASPVVTTSDEQTSPISLQEFDEFKSQLFKWTKSCPATAIFCKEQNEE